MMKKAVRIIGALLCAFMFCSSLGYGAFAVEPSTEAEALRFNSDSSFKILHLTDLHMHDEYDRVQQTSELLIKKIVVREKPDVVVITGDIAMNETLEKTLENIDNLMKMFDELKVPVAVNFGNHDSERGLISREDLLKVYMQYDCCIAADDGELLPGAGTYNIPILSSDGSKVAFNLWMIDSGEYDSEGNYASTDPAITRWYVEKSNSLKAQNNGKPVNSLMFQHIIVPEIYDALKKSTLLNPFAVGSIINKKERYVLDSGNTNAGRLLETPCPPVSGRGQFDAVAAQGDVLAMFFGHDHLNTFNVSFRGVDLVATPKAQYGMTGDFKSDFTDCRKGARIIELNENDTSKYETHVITFADLYKWSDIKTITDSFEKKTALQILADDWLYDVLIGTSTKLVELITGSRIDFG